MKTTKTMFLGVFNLVLISSLCGALLADTPSTNAPAPAKAACTSCQGSGKCASCKGAGSASCGQCQGKGKQRDRCSHCGGDGRVSRTTRSFGKTRRTSTSCSTCGGRGYREKSCGSCGGDGKVNCSKCNGSAKCQTCKPASK